MASGNPLTAPVNGAEHREVAGVSIDMTQVGDGRVRRVIYPVGFRWSKHMKPIIGSDLCMHAHVGFLLQGRIHMQYTDGCVVEFEAPQAVVIDPGHDGWVEGNEPAILIEFDFAGDTAKRFGLVEKHRH